MKEHKKSEVERREEMGRQDKTRHKGGQNTNDEKRADDMR